MCMGVWNATFPTSLNTGILIIGFFNGLAFCGIQFGTPSFNSYLIICCAC